MEIPMEKGWQMEFGAGITVHNQELAPLEELMADFTGQYFNFPGNEQAEEESNTPQ